MVTAEELKLEGCGPEGERMMQGKWVGFVDLRSTRKHGMGAGKEVDQMTPPKLGFNFY